MIGGVLGGGFALQMPCRTGEEAMLSMLPGTSNSVANRTGLPVWLTSSAIDGLGVGVDQFGEFGEHPCAVDRGGGRPAAQRGAGGRDGAVDVGRRGQAISATGLRWPD